LLFYDWSFFIGRLRFVHLLSFVIVIFVISPFNVVFVVCFYVIFLFVVFIGFVLYD
jgi:hypothetical protein